MNDKTIHALVNFFVNTNQLRHVRGNDGGYALEQEIEKLADQLNVDMTADGDTIEMGVREALK